MNRFFFVAIILLVDACSISLVNKRDTNTFINPFLTTYGYCSENIPKEARTMIFAAAAIYDLNNLQFNWFNPNSKITEKLPPGYSMTILDGLKKDTTSITLNISNTAAKVQSLAHFTYIASKEKNKTIYCDPKNKSTGDGSKENPFGSLQSLMDSGYQPSLHEVIYLLDGNHGWVNLHGGNFTIAAASGHSPVVTGLHFTKCKNIIIHSLQIQSRLPINKYLVTIDTASEGIRIQNSKIGSLVSDDELSLKNWKAYVSSGIACYGKSSLIKGNLIQYTFHGLQTDGDQNIVSNNIIDRFCGDAIRNTGNDNQYTENFLTNALIDDYYDPSGNHDDLFQAWTHDKPISNITIKKNIAISTTDPNLPNRSKIVQGLVCFDGFTEQWLIDSNVVVTDHPHGISLYGAKNCIITNNVVLRNPHKFYNFESDPWIMINDHKDKRNSENITVSKNVAPKFNILSKNTSFKDNTTIDSIYFTKFIKYHGWTY